MFCIEKDIEEKILDEKSRRKVLAHGSDLMICNLKFKTGGVGKLHKHPHAQITYVIKGKFEYTVKGESQVLGPGDSVYVKGDEEHGMLCLEEGEIIDAFAPERKDFLE